MRLVVWNGEGRQGSSSTPEVVTRAADVQSSRRRGGASLHVDSEAVARAGGRV